MTEVAPVAGIPSTPATSAAWNMGDWNKKRRSSPEPDLGEYVVHVEHLGPLLEQGALGEARRSAGVHRELPSSDSSGSGGMTGSPDRQQVLVGDGVRLHRPVDPPSPPPPMMTTLSIFAPASRARSRSAANTGSVKTTLASRIVEDVGELGGSETDVEWVDDARSEHCGVIELEVLVAVHGQHRETVAWPHAQLALSWRWPAAIDDRMVGEVPW